MKGHDVYITGVVYHPFRRFPDTTFATQTQKDAQISIYARKTGPTDPVTRNVYTRLDRIFDAAVLVRSVARRRPVFQITDEPSKGAFS